MIIELRRNQNTLVVVGQGIISFGVYMALRVILSALLEPARFTGGVVETDPFLAYIVVGIILLLFIGADMLLRLYVGRHAIREGKGQSAGNLYIVLAALMALIDLAMVVADVIGLNDHTRSYLEKIVTLISDVTIMVTTTELIVAAVRVKKLRRALAEGV